MHRRSLIAGAAIATLTGGATMSDTARRRPKTRPGEHALYGPETGPRGDRDVSRHRAEARGADQDAGARGVLRQHAVPPGDRGLHGAGRRSDRHRHRRFEAAQPAGGIHHQAAFPARHLRHGAHLGPEQLRTASSSSCSPRRRIWTGSTRSGARWSQGMEFVDQIKRGSGSGGTVQNPDRIVHMRVAADVKG